jgi:hypothetical protein
MLDLPIKFEKASEPTDIIWENRHHSSQDSWDNCAVLLGKAND